MMKRILISDPWPLTSALRRVPPQHCRCDEAGCNSRRAMQWKQKSRPPALTSVLKGHAFAGVLALPPSITLEKLTEVRGCYHDLVRSTTTMFALVRRGVVWISSVRDRMLSCGRFRDGSSELRRENSSSALNPSAAATK